MLRPLTQYFPAQALCPWLSQNLPEPFAQKAAENSVPALAFEA